MPSTGNWSAACQSHYWIRDNKVDWARGYSAEQIAANRASDWMVREQAWRESGSWGRRSIRLKAFWKNIVE